jgi:hypothetical protein
LRLRRWLRDLAVRALAAHLLGSAQTAAENRINRYVRPAQTKRRRCMPNGYRRRIIYL